MVSLLEYMRIFQAAKVFFHIPTNSPMVQIQCEASGFVHAARDSVPVLPVQTDELYPTPERAVPRLEWTLPEVRMLFRSGLHVGQNVGSHVGEVQSAINMVQGETYGENTNSL